MRRSIPLSCVFVLFASVLAAQAPSGYYDTVDTTNGTTIRQTLHDVIDDHTRFPYTSSAIDTWDILEMADENPNNTNQVLDVYKNETYPKHGGGNSDYNREHSWPKSYGFPNDGSGNYPYTDCHHLFISNDSYNSSRNNKPYDDCVGGGCTEKITFANDGAGGPGESNWTQSGVWETWIGRRGDVARALFYLDVRYEGGTHGITGKTEPDLILTDNASLINVTSGNASTAYMGMLSTLILWHEADPVDAKEIWRNEVVYSFQGNRNPFIDNPDWVDCVFTGDCSGAGGGGSDPWINEFHYDDSGSDTGEFVEVAGKAGTSLSGWKVLGYNGSNGSVYKTVNLSGSIPNQSGGYGTLSFTFSGMQNGAPDALALVDDSNNVIEFISYEGSMTASSGTASGMTSTDIGVSENGSTPAGYSLQLGDSGWQSPQVDTPGAINTNQTFGGGDTTPPAVPSGLSLTLGNAEVAADWTANSESDLAGYNIYRSTSSGGTYTKLNGSTLAFNTYIDTGVSNGTTYWYKVSAVDTSGNESALSGSVSGTPQAPPTDPWINEFHYDDSGSDQNEGVEIAGVAGTSLNGWTVYLYNGNGGGYYSTISLSGSIDNEGSGTGARWFSKSGIQNGGSDGIALVDPNGNVVQFISYEGSLTATNGPANGMTSTDVGVSETSSSSSSQSLQFNGSTWVGPNNHSRGSLNSGQ